MKILILGARGMLGQALYRGLTQNGRGTDAEIFGWDREDCDITDEKQAKEKISALGPEVIINCAAYNNVDKAESEDRELAMKVNGEAVGYLAQTAAEVGAILVHYSSDYVFKGDKKEGYKEDDEPEPASWYGKTKLEGEKRLLSLRGVNEMNDEAISRQKRGIASPAIRRGRNDRAELKYYLIRTSRLFGPAGVAEGAKKSFVDKMLELDKKSCHSRPVSRYGVNSGGNPDIGLDIIDEELSSPTYVKDLARATIELIESKAPWGIYHRTNSGFCTWYGWAKKIFEIAKMDVKLNSVPVGKFPRPAARPKYSILLNTKLPAMRRWEEALEEYLKTD